MKTLYISDLDGTLMMPNVEISAVTKRILNELIGNGMLFTVATARTIASVRTILEGVNIHMPIILMNGVCIYDLPANRYLKVEAFSNRSRKLLLDLIAENGLKGYAYAIENEKLSTYYEDLETKALKTFYVERVQKYRKTFTKLDSFRELIDATLIYFTLMDQKEALEPVYEMIKDTPELNCVLYKDNYSEDTWYLEIYSKDASKYHAVQFLRKYLKPDCIIGFGDNRNDIPLFAACDRKYAVGNAVDELKAKANAVIKSNTEDGVGLWLQENFLKPTLFS